MGFWDVLKEIQAVTQVAAPVAAEFYPPAAPIVPLINAAMSIVSVVHNGGQPDQAVIAQLNALLAPYNLVVVAIPTPVKPPGV